MKKEYSETFVSREVKRLSKYVDCSFALLAPSVFLILPEENLEDRELVRKVVAEECRNVISNPPDFTSWHMEDERVAVGVGDRVMAIGAKTSITPLPFGMLIDARQKALDACERGMIIALYNAVSGTYQMFWDEGN